MTIEPITLENQDNDRLLKRKEYMRTYMNTRYHANIDKSRAYIKSAKCRRVNNLEVCELTKYGGYLVEVHKLRQILKNLPVDIINEILRDAGTYGSPHAPL